MRVFLFIYFVLAGECRRLWRSIFYTSLSLSSTQLCLTCCAGFLTNELFYFFTRSIKDMDSFARLHLKWIFLRHIQLLMATKKTSVDGPSMGIQSILSNNSYELNLKLWTFFCCCYVLILLFTSWNEKKKTKTWFTLSQNIFLLIIK